MSLECKVQIRIAELSESTAIAVRDALAPDNIEFPQGQSIKMDVTADSLIVIVNGGTLTQFIATVDEVLEHASVALEATMH